MAINYDWERSTKETTTTAMMGLCAEPSVRRGENTCAVRALTLLATAALR